MTYGKPKGRAAKSNPAWPGAVIKLRKADPRLPEAGPFPNADAAEEMKMRETASLSSFDLGCLLLEIRTAFFVGSAAHHRRFRINCLG